MSESKHPRTFIRILGPLPKTAYVACSGGPDSMAAVDFLSRDKKRSIQLAFFHHNTETSSKSLDIVLRYATTNSLKLSLDGLSRDKFKDESFEEYWRNERYRYLNSIPGQVITAHNLDDVMETWIFTSLHGKPSLIPYQNKNVIRPFLLADKATLLAWCIRNQAPFYEDPSNHQVDKFTRAWIRFEVIPRVLRVNPGLRKTIRKLILAKYEVNPNDDSSRYFKSN